MCEEERSNISTLDAITELQQSQTLQATCNRQGRARVRDIHLRTHVHDHSMLWNSNISKACSMITRRGYVLQGTRRLTGKLELANITWRMSS